MSWGKMSQLPVVLGGKSLQEYIDNVAVLQSSFLGLTLFLLYIDDLPDVLYVKLLSMLIILLSTLDVIRHLIFGNN